MTKVVAGCVLRNAVDQHQHVTPAQGLAEVAHSAAGGGHAGYQLAEDIGDPAAGAALLTDLLFVDDLHRAWNRGNARFAASGGNDRGFHVQGTWLLGVLGPGLGADGADNRNQQGKSGGGHKTVFFNFGVSCAAGISTIINNKVANRPYGKGMPAVVF
ncbi:hypothetical protein D3C84_440170 [compost metagenome]